MNKNYELKKMRENFEAIQKLIDEKLNQDMNDVRCIKDLEAFVGMQEKISKRISDLEARC